MTTTCRGCSFDPMCRTKKEMRARHGLPSDLWNGLLKAQADGFITMTEAEAGIAKYREDYDAAVPE